jgi:hypothetical protein
MDFPDYTFTDRFPSDKMIPTWKTTPGNGLSVNALCYTLNGNGSLQPRRSA